ncbi:MAG TPA: isochorismatase family protein [candidate division Zixibacteria bacterium]|nr:isochorismatase family protein [candidate division Zixibacteria bacterium]
MVDYRPTTALLVVDVQNDFAHPEGSLYVRGGEELVPRINDEVQRAVAAGALVVYTQDWHPESTPHFAKDGGIWPVHCVMNTWGAEFHPKLVVVGETIRKGTNGEDGYSGFMMRDPVTGEQTKTPLDGLLREHGIRSVVVCGLATDYCVGSTVIDAQRLGYRATVLTDLCRAVDLQPGDGERRLQEAAAAGAEIA